MGAQIPHTNPLQSQPQQKPRKQITENDYAQLNEIGEFNFSKLRPHEYATPQFLKFTDASLSWSHKALYIGALVVIAYCIVSDGTYNEIEYGVGSAVLNAEGTASADLSDNNMARMMFDNFDIRLPEQEKNAIFVASRIIGYKEQQRSKLDGSDQKCFDIASKCPCDANTFTTNGVATGGCANSKCEITGWCTAESKEENKPNLEIKYDALLDGLDEILITFETNIEFHNFGISKSVNLKERKFDFNVWRIGDILKGVNEVYANVRDKGIIIVVNMNWDCGDGSGQCIVDFNLFRVDN